MTTEINNDNVKQLKNDITERVHSSLCVKNSEGVCISPELITARQLWESKLIYWITSYKALLKYVSTRYTHIFNPTIVGAATGKRYYVKPENIVEFLVKFETNTL